MPFITNLSIREKTSDESVPKPLSGWSRRIEDHINDLVVVVGSNGALTENLDPFLALKTIGTDEPDDVRHEGASILYHDFWVAVTVESRPAKSM